jgi:hypothetical protein
VDLGRGEPKEALEAVDLGRGEPNEAPEAVDLGESENLSGKDRQTRRAIGVAAVRGALQRASREDIPHKQWEAGITPLVAYPVICEGGEKH